METRDLTGMRIRSIEFTHDVSLPLSSLFKQLSKHFKSENLDGILIMAHTECNLEDPGTLITLLIFEEL